MVQQDQISLMNETVFKNYDKIERLENELNMLRKLYVGKRNLSIARAVYIDIPPSTLSSIPDDQKRLPWPDWT